MKRRTIAHLTRARRDRFGERVLHYHHDGHRWAPTTWYRSGEQSDELALGLHSLGVRHGDRVAIISDTRCEWTTIDTAILMLGAVTVGVYPTSTPEQVAYILEHSEATVVFVEDAAQLAKVASIRGQLGALRTMVLVDEGPGEETSRPDAAAAYRGTAAGEHLSMTQVMFAGLELGREQPDLLLSLVDKVFPEDVATLVYTSGTTGPPKGVVLTHQNLFEIAAVASAHTGVNEDDVSVVFLPLAHSLQRVSLYGGIYAGSSGYFAPSIDRLLETWQQAQPTVVSSVPRIFEKMHARIMTQLGQASAVRRKLFESAIAVGRKRSRAIERRQKVPRHIELAWKAFDRVVFSKVRSRLFGERVRFLISGGAPIAKELLEFFHAMGLLILEGYGLTETSAPATLNQPHDFRFGSVGRALPGVGVKIADDGEILINGPGLFREYYKDEAATREAIDADGWFHSGDIGRLDDDGFLYITDRKKDIIVTAGGKNIAPQNIENLIKSDKHISQIMVHGDRRKYLVALVTLDAEEMAEWSRRTYGDERTMQQLVADPAVVKLVQGVIDKANSQLARYETLKKFKLVAEDFSVANDMLTPTLKVKRRVIEKRYGDLLEAMYD
ncbi:MAG: long-chain fatty acid--CoA ligase [Myxococcales bacterium]|nr:long-chain fatty acid--CoA ligase [Myxococcales bacterium]